MKKTTNKTKSPTPATTAPKATKKKTSKPAEAAPQADTLNAPVTPKAVQPVADAPVPVQAVKAVTAAPVQTKIVARLDVGFGNRLYIRGDGPGLSWNQGIAMECVASDQWELVLGESSQPISFKILLNDATWCTGPDSVVASGSTITVAPEFA